MVETGVTFPVSGETRSTSDSGRTIVSAALRNTDAAGARAASHEADWRRGYLGHFRRLIEAGLVSRDDAVRIATDGVAAVAATMRYQAIDADGEPTAEIPLSDIGELKPSVTLGHRLLTGTGQKVTELSLPYRGELLSGDARDRQLDTWVRDGIIEPSVAESVKRVAANPEWLSLPGKLLIALGAGAEIGPTPTFLRWGAQVAALDLPRPEIWKRLGATTAQTAGSLHTPVHDNQAGLDVLTRLPGALAWTRRVIAETGLQPVLGNYAYADGQINLKLSAAGDALGTELRRSSPDLVQAWLATPTDVFAVPGAAVEQSTHNFDSNRRPVRRGLRAISGGRLLQRNYLPGSDPGINDSLVPQQGPNYALAKRMQRWRATTELAEGRLASLNVAPPTRTRSVVKNRALAAAYAGAHRFGVEVFEPETTRVLMAALLVHDLYAEQPGFGQAGFDQPWQAEAHNAAHGGLWRTAYSPRSALGLAALLGYGASRG